MLKVSSLLKATKGKLASGKTGAAIPGFSIDSRTLKPKEAFIAIKGANFDGHDFINEAVKKGASCIIQARGQRSEVRGKVSFIEVKDTIKALGDIARYQREEFDIPVIAVTGSNGKTTTKEMISCVLSKKFKVLKNEGTKNNHIGLPQTLLKLDKSYDLAVLEVGTNHFGEVSYLGRICRPNIGVITNIGQSHLEYFKNLSGVFKEKSSLLKQLKPPSIAIINADDAFLKRGAVKKNNTFSIGINNPADFFASEIKCLSGMIEFFVNTKYKFTLKTLGIHNVYNALAAVASARIFGMEYKDIVKALTGFDFPPSRLKIIHLSKIRFIDDTYNANPVSLGQALDVLYNFQAKGRKIFVMGDMLELGEQGKLFHYEAGRRIAGICDVLIAVGKLSKLASEAAKVSGLDTRNIFNCATSAQARKILFKKLSVRQDDIVLVKGSRGMNLEEVFKT